MYLKVTPFNFALLTLGCLEDGDAARLVGMTSKTIKNVRGGAPASDEFMANTMAAFALNAERLRTRGIKIKIDEFFEWGTREEREAAQLAEAVA